MYITQVAEFNYADMANEWIRENNENISITDFKYVGNRHYGTSILIIYRLKEDVIEED